MHGSGSFCPCGRYSVALSLTPSRSGIFTPQRKSTGLPASAAGAAADARDHTSSAQARANRTNINSLPSETFAYFFGAAIGRYNALGCAAS